MSVYMCLLIAIGGAVGTLARYGISVLTLPISRELPWGTILINIAGSFVIGFFGLKAGPSLADTTRINCPAVASGDVHAPCSHHLHRRLGLRNRLLHHRATPTADDQPGEHPARVAI